MLRIQPTMLFDNHIFVRPDDEPDAAGRRFRLCLCCRKRARAVVPAQPPAPLAPPPPPPTASSSSPRGDDVALDKIAPMAAQGVKARELESFPPEHPPA
eukprot:SAG11_NODE_20158_length_451_cov_1.312500_2_plen_98_part_01